MLEFELFFIRSPHDILYPRRNRTIQFAQPAAAAQAIIQIVGNDQTLYIKLQYSTS